MVKLGSKKDQVQEEDVLANARRRAIESVGIENQVVQETLSPPQVGQVAATDPRLSRLKVVPIGRIRDGRYQTRMVSDPESDAQLKKQIEEDLKTHQTLEHVFIVCVDPKDRSYYNPKRGGHRRLEIARSLGVREVYIWVEEYDPEEMARGTYFENAPGARQEINIVEEGELFRRVQEDLSWTQSTIAVRFSVDGGQPHVARCIQAASYPDDVKQMLFHDPERGMRAAEKLAQLEVLGSEKARELRSPLIVAFRKKELSTDGVALAVDRLLGKSEEGKSTPNGASTLSVAQLRRLERATTARKSFNRYEREIGEDPPSMEERTELESLKTKIDEILTRQ